MKKIQIFLLPAVAFLFFSCEPEPIQLNVEDRFGALPTQVIHPADNPYSIDKGELGKLLFWDPILSGNKDIACVSCHHPKAGYAENLDLSIGVGGAGLSDERTGGKLINRNAPSILNTAFNGIDAFGIYEPQAAPMFWDSRIESLEHQAIEPILSAEEMRGNTISRENIMDTLIQRLTAIPEYNSRFEHIFGENNITSENIGKAIAAFERTLIANNSRFDQYANGDETALSNFEIRGMINFIEAGCANCHGGSMFSNFELHILTVPENNKLSSPDIGDGTFAFRTPTLRNLSFTAPYMHNGVFETLEEVMEFYDESRTQSQNPNISNNQIDEEHRQGRLRNDQVQSIIAFMKSLDDSDFDNEILENVPSGLIPGGNIN